MNSHSLRIRPRKRESAKEADVHTLSLPAYALLRTLSCTNKSTHKHSDCPKNTRYANYSNTATTCCYFHSPFN
uniref:Ovule protein n=1 Tax=Heterorhabditis bacteriophora TaxID=37862 RepID=A0A1I7WZI2_HETBA